MAALKLETQTLRTQVAERAEARTSQGEHLPRAGGNLPRRTIDRSEDEPELQPIEFRGEFSHWKEYKHFCITMREDENPYEFLQRCQRHWKFIPNIDDFWKNYHLLVGMESRSPYGKRLEQSNLRDILSQAVIPSFQRFGKLAVNVAQGTELHGSSMRIWQALRQKENDEVEDFVTRAYHHFQLAYPDGSLPVFFQEILQKICNENLRTSLGLWVDDQDENLSLARFTRRIVNSAQIIYSGQQKPGSGWKGLRTHAIGEALNWEKVNKRRMEDPESMEIGAITGTGGQMEGQGFNRRKTDKKATCFHCQFEGHLKRDCKFMKDRIFSFEKFKQWYLQVKGKREGKIPPGDDEGWRRLYREMAKQERRRHAGNPREGRSIQQIEWGDDEGTEEGPTGEAINNQDFW